MIQIDVKPEEVEQAKRMAIEFDAVKHYEKFKCKNNYIGILGEIVFHRYLTEQGVDHEWSDFIQPDMSRYDFKIHGHTVDLKTTYTDGLWFQKPKFDIYVMAKMFKNNKVMVIRGWMTREQMIDALNNGDAEAIKREFRTDYVIDFYKLNPIDKKITFK